MGNKYHALNALLHEAQTLLIIGASASYVDFYLVHTQSLLKVSDCLNNALESLSNICEVGDTATNDENLKLSRSYIVRPNDRRAQQVDEYVTLPPLTGSPLVISERIVLAYSNVSDSVGSPEYSP